MIVVRAIVCFFVSGFGVGAGLYIIDRIAKKAGW